MSVLLATISLDPTILVPPYRPLERGSTYTGQRQGGQRRSYSPYAIDTTYAVYRSLHQRGDRSEISRFIERLVRPYTTGHDTLEAMYREAAANTGAEQEALEWIEVSVDDALP